MDVPATQGVAFQPVTNMLQLGPGGHRPRIIWAHDGSCMSESMAHELALRYETETFTEGDAALLAIVTTPPDLVLADAKTRWLDGMRLLKSLRESVETRAIPFMMLSSGRSESARHQALAAGADDYVVTPIGARDLVRRIASRLDLFACRTADRPPNQLATVVAQVPFPIATITGDDLIFEMANPAYVRMAGGRSLVGRPMREAVPEIAGSHFEEALREVMRSGEPYVVREAPVRLDGQGDGWLEDTLWNCVYSPRRGAHGEIDGLIAVCSEVTYEFIARQRAQILAQQASVEAVAGHKAQVFRRVIARRKDEFMAMLSHG